MRFKLVVHEGSIKQRFEKWGRATGPKSMAQLGLGTSVPYKCDTTMITNLSTLTLQINLSTFKINNNKKLRVLFSRNLKQ